ncbi:MAG: hypothetical protein PHH54_00290 [Candidatus Nanoarchaeia archaeon]|nr:hypothetical protein [Candidatus Nanoarchaeia archaeon]MDD5740401.1 hypothetical protein [Candidatus Nanoarchaeia archaeon]
MFNSQKHAFWEALLITILIFGIGVFFGVILENWRSSKISDLYDKSEIELLDMRIQDEIYSKGKFNCDIAAEENLNLADKIYGEAKLLERYEGARRITDSLIIQHKKYDLLREMLFLNSMHIKEQCKLPYYAVVYFYIPAYEELSLDETSKQQVFSKLLEELKQKRGKDVLLIPIAVNQDISSIQVITNLYNISREDLPVILINEKTKITEVRNIEQIEQYLK